MDSPFGLWTKCDAVFADYFLSNWTAREEPLAFLLYDSPPDVPSGAPVFIHSDGHLRLIVSRPVVKSPKRRNKIPHP